jgi:hypothetical protein
MDAKTHELLWEAVRKGRLTRRGYIVRNGAREFAFERRFGPAARGFAERTGGLLYQVFVDRETGESHVLRV